jgi:hypothetical protein
MPRRPLIVYVWLACVDARAGGLDAGKTGPAAMLSSAGGHFVRAAGGAPPPAPEPRPAAPAGPPKHAADQAVSTTPLERAIAGAAKKGLLEQGVEASRDALLACQRETSAVLTTPLMRSDSQRDHCFRF